MQTVVKTSKISASEISTNIKNIEKKQLLLQRDHMTCSWVVILQLRNIHLRRLQLTN